MKNKTLMDDRLDYLFWKFNLISFLMIFMPSLFYIFFWLFWHRLESSFQLKWSAQTFNFFQEDSMFKYKVQTQCLIHSFVKFNYFGDQFKLHSYFRNFLLKMLLRLVIIWFVIYSHRVLWPIVRTSTTNV